MDKLQILKRQIVLKEQARQLVYQENTAEIFRLKLEHNLLLMKAHFEGQIKEGFNSGLSKKIDCLIFLIEN